jgi:LPXTG-site transpeptidase (sortase) family protein
MENILDSKTAFARSSSRLIISSRNYSHARKKANVSTVQRANMQHTTSGQRFSKVTPIYASIPSRPVITAKRSVQKGVEFVKTKKHPKIHHAASHAHHNPDTKSLEFVEAHLDAIDLDLTDGAIENYALLPSESTLTSDGAVRPQTSLIQRYFENQSDELRHKRSSDKKTHRIKIRPKHVRWFFVMVLLVSVIGVWGYILSDGFALTHRVNAVNVSGLSTSDEGLRKATYNPKTLTIAKLDIHSSIDSVNLTEAGAMGVPSNIWNAGWYVGSSQPGQSGAVFIDGHSSSSRGALFGNLDTLVTGDQIEVERIDGTKVKYSVAKVSVVNRHDVDMTTMLQPYEPHKNGLNIMSCVGDWIASEQTLKNRVLVYATQI